MLLATAHTGSLLTSPPITERHDHPQAVASSVGTADGLGRTSAQRVGTELTMDDYDDECSDCQGTGIGDPHAETSCPSCGGSGVSKCDDYDDEPDFDCEPDVDWDTPQDCGTDSRGRAW